MKRLFKKVCIFLKLKLLELCAFVGLVYISIIVVMAVELLIIKVGIVPIIVTTFVFLFKAFIVILLLYCIYDWIKSNWKWAEELLNK